MRSNIWKQLWVTGVLFVGARAYADLNAGLVAYYPLNGNASDVSGNGHNGASGRVIPVVDRFGRTNAALHFDGTAQTCIRVAAPLIGSNPFTWSFWFRTDSPGSVQILIAQGNAPGTGQLSPAMHLNDPSGVLRFWTYPPPHADVKSQSRAWNSTHWYHVAGVSNTSSNRWLYIDGVCEGTGTWPFGSVTTNFYIGGNPPFSSEYCNGDIDDVRIYNRALSPAEVQDLYYLGQAQNAVLSNVRGSQRPGTSIVEIPYTLTLSNASSANVSLTISTNDGATFSVFPGAGALSGDLVGVPPGSRRITWNAGQTLPSATFGTAFKARVTAIAGGAPGSGDSSRFTLDLQGLAGGLSVSGRVLDFQTRTPLSGATVAIAGQTATTTGAGAFVFPSIALSNGNTLTASNSGYVTYSDTLDVHPGSSVHTVPDIYLQLSPPMGHPVVTSVKAKYDGLLLGGIHYQNEYTAAVNWNGATPGVVRFYANGVLVSSVPGNSSPLALPLDVGTCFRPSFQWAANQITVVAESAALVQSAPAVKYVDVIPLPLALQNFLGDYVQYDDGWELGISLGLHFPEPPWTAKVHLPVVGDYGLEWSFIGRGDYNLPSGEWELTIGAGVEGKQGKRGRRPDLPGLTRYPKMKLYIGNKEVEGELTVSAKGTALPGQGITLDDELTGHLSIDAKLELGRFGLPDLLGPGLSTTLGEVPGVDKILDTVTILIYARPGFDGNAVVFVRPKFRFKEGDFTGKLGLEAAYEPDLGPVEARFYVGGEPSVTFQYNPTNGLSFKELRFRAYAGAELHAWIFDVGPVEYVFVNEVIAPTFIGEPAVLRVVGRTGPHPMKRDYLHAGLERFAAKETQHGGRLADGTAVSKQDAFVAMKQVGVARDLEPEGTKTPGPNRLDPEQADWTIAENVFPVSQPALAARNTELMLLYVSDRGFTNDLQFTEIAWTRFDGTNWSEPLTIRTNTQAEFAPQVAYDGNDDAIAVWERVADPNFTSTNLTDMAAQMEIVWSRWSKTNGAWSEPDALTFNSYLDHAPLLCGPMSDGSLLAVWTENEANLLLGTNGAGADTVSSSRWSPETRSWTTLSTPVPKVSCRLSQSLAGTSNLAVYAWTSDLDGVLTNDADQEVFYCVWTNGSWSPVNRLTTNGLPDKTIRAAVSPAGDVYLVWQQGTNLVMTRNFSTNTTVVRPNSQTAGFADFALTFSPAGNLVLIWQEMSQDGADPYYSAYDPVSGTWSKDARLFADSSLERSFATAWDSATNLNVAFNRVEILLTNKTVGIEGGGTVTITNVPQPGRVDLAVVSRKLIKDLALQEGDFIIQGDDFLPGDALTLSATVHNTGDLAMTNILVEFFNGNPTNGGILLTNAIISGWLEGATSAVATVTWVVPAPATNRTLFAVVNRTNSASEFNTANNIQSVSIGGTDLTVSLVSAVAQTNGSARVLATVQNIGAPSATNSILAIRRQGQTNAPLATVGVPILEPGRLAQVALDLPPGTQPAGEAVYTLLADDTHVTGDVDTNNNATSFAVNLWIDSDNDGIPDDWMVQHFGHPTGLEGDHSRAQDDADGDGMSSLAEYVAGTDPLNANSYLRINSLSVGGTNGVQVVWGSATNKLYAVQRTQALGGGAVFTDVVQHILSTPPQNSYLDFTATNSAAFFYRIRVE